MHEKYFICYIETICYKYYMKIEAADSDLLHDGWIDLADDVRTDRPEVSLSCGDTVLYCTAGAARKPAVLVAPSGDGGWLARGARLVHSLVYLDSRSIVLRLPRNELVEESA